MRPESLMKRALRAEVVVAAIAEDAGVEEVVVPETRSRRMMMNLLLPIQSQLLNR
jgi:hypothetical protein